jgi:hypothetical protein
VNGANVKTTIRRPDGSFEYAKDIIKRCEADPERYDRTVRRLARYDGLIARKGRGNAIGGLWYFVDQQTMGLVGPREPLSDQEALDWLLSE